MEVKCIKLFERVVIVENKIILFPGNKIIIFNFNLNHLCAVSYTHLDVYKRQLLSSAQVSKVLIL